MQIQIYIPVDIDRDTYRMLTFNDLDTDRVTGYIEADPGMH